MTEHPAFFAALALAPFAVVWVPFTIAEAARLVAAAVTKGDRHGH